MEHALRSFLGVCLLTTAGCQDGQLVLRDLVYLQTVAQDYATVMYVTAEPLASRVDYCYLPPDGGRPSLRTVEIPEQTTMHKVVLPDLASDGTYRYLVGADAGEHAPPFGSDACTYCDGMFTRAPDDAPFVFFAIGDTHGNRDMMSSLLPSSIGDTFLIHTGDAVIDKNNPAAWLLDFFLPGQFALPSLPVYATMGNHDENLQWFLQYHAYPGGKSYYAFTHGRARFIVLDTTLDYLPGSAQHTWLRQELASAEATEATWRVAVFHHPPFRAGWSTCSMLDGDQTVRDVLVPLLETSRVDLVLNGHVHGYERGTLNGVTYVSTGGGGGALDHFCRRGPHILATAYVNHSVRFEVSPTKIVGTAYGLERQLLDTFTLVR